MENLKFENLEIRESIKRALREINYVDATEIQSKAIPVILQGKDVIGLSQTGTGKTASYSLPVIEKIDTNSRKLQALVLCPTRELAVQVAQEVRKFTKYTEGIRTLAVYGGQSIERQIKALKGGVQIVIGTPGRVMDHIRRKTLKLDKVNMVVLDEADEMLSMGFEEDIEEILKYVPEQRQTLLFSATMNERIMSLTKKYLNNPTKIKIKAKALTVDNINQISLDMKQGMKDEAVTRLIDLHRPKKCIVFCNTKKKVDQLIELLKEKDYKAEALHGDIKQSQRDRIMKKMKQGDFQILVATDVVARGIDIEDLELVINYDIPQEEEYYIHRIGRTGRNGNEGKAFTFVVGKEKRKLYEIQKYANTKIQPGKIPSLKEVSEVKNKEMIQSIQNVIDNGEFHNEDVFNQLLKQNNDLKQVAKALFTMVVDKKEISPKNDIIADKNGNVKLFFSLGKKDKIMAKDIVGSVAANTAVSGAEIGRINVLDKFSFVEIPVESVEEIMSGMNGKQIKGKTVNIEIANS